MKILMSKIKNRWKVTYKNFKTDCNFSIFYALLRVLDELGGSIRLKKCSNWAYKKRINWIRKYIEKQLNDIVSKYKNIDFKGEYIENAPVWICWWDGVDKAPKIVQQCIKSTMKAVGKHPVHFIDKNTYLNYVEIPEYMLKKMDDGSMGLAHLADYLRIALLEKYGGLWLDATIFCAFTLKEEVFLYPFYTCKSQQMECRYISKMQWTTFVLGGWKGNIFYSFLKDAFEVYWKKNRYAIDYLFFDYMIEYAKEHIETIGKYMEIVPINNLRRDDLQAAMNSRLPANQFDNIVQEDTVLYKLSWRETYFLETNEGEESIYAKFLNMEL